MCNVAVIDTSSHSIRPNLVYTNLHKLMAVGNNYDGSSELDSHYIILNWNLSSFSHINFVSKTISNWQKNWFWPTKGERKKIWLLSSDPPPSAPLEDKIKNFIFLNFFLYIQQSSRNNLKWTPSIEKLIKKQKIWQSMTEHGMLFFFTFCLKKIDFF